MRWKSTAPFTSLGCWRRVLLHEYSTTARRPENGSWSEPQTLVSGIHPRERYEGPFLQLAVDSAGLPHLAWSDKSPDEIFYIQRQAGGSWSQILNISNTPFASWAPELLLDTTGIVHVLWSDTREGLDADILYANSAASITGSSHIRQTVSLPAEPSACTLSFLYQFPGTELASGKRFELRIEDGSTSTVLFATDSLANDWNDRWFDMTPWAGHTVTLDFVVDQPAGQPCSWVQLDEVSLGGSYSAPFPHSSISSQPRSRPAAGDGQQFLPLR